MKTSIFLSVLFLGSVAFAESQIAVNPSVVEDLAGQKYYHSIQIHGDAAKTIYDSLKKPERKDESSRIVFLYRDGNNILCGHPQMSEDPKHYFCVAFIDPFGRISKLVDVQQ